MALGIEMEKKRDVAQMSAAAVGFFLDREGHKKFLRTATNQELEAENTALKAYIEQLEERNDDLYNDMLKAESTVSTLDRKCDELERQLIVVEDHRDHFKKRMGQ